MLQSTLKTQTEDHSGKWKTSSPAKAELPSSYSPRRLVQADLVCGVKLRLLYFNYNGFLKDIFTYICHHHKLLIFLTHHLHPPPSAPFPSWWFFLPLNSPPLLSSHTICVYVSVRPSAVRPSVRLWKHLEIKWQLSKELSSLLSPWALGLAARDFPCWAVQVYSMHTFNKIIIQWLFGKYRLIGLWYFPNVNILERQ